MRIKLTRALAFRAGLDAGNRAMHAGKRTAWSKADQRAAWREFERLWPVCLHGAEPHHCALCPAISAGVLNAEYHIN